MKYQTSKLKHISTHIFVTKECSKNNVPIFKNRTGLTLPNGEIIFRAFLSFKKLITGMLEQIGETKFE